MIAAASDPPGIDPSLAVRMEEQGFALGACHASLYIRAMHKFILMIRSSAKIFVQVKPVDAPSLETFHLPFAMPSPSLPWFLTDAVRRRMIARYYIGYRKGMQAKLGREIRLPHIPVLWPKNAGKPPAKQSLQEAA